jgi:RNA polymerase sigma factor (sigma-70 family)
MAMMIDDPHFRNFATSLEHAIECCGETDDEDFLARQKRQVETLVFLEKQFKKTVIGSAKGERIYKGFVKFICDERKNILDARPYFRERQHVFTKYISTALRKRAVKQLYRFNFNYRFVQFVMNFCPWKPKSPITKLANQIRAIRDELITMNMPLAISRARIFYSRTPKAHLTYMDLIQIACEGLMSGIDKFVLPFSKAFRSVAIGRMTGNFIENYSETQIHFYPVDKRKLYRANKLVGRGATTATTVDFTDLAKNVNKGVEPAHRTNASEIANLMSAASTVSSDTPVSDDDDETARVSDRFAAPADTQPDVICERADSMRQMAEAMTVLSAFEQKVLQLRGVSL